MFDNFTNGLCECGRFLIENERAPKKAEPTRTRTASTRKLEARVGPSSIPSAIRPFNSIGQRAMELGRISCAAVCVTSESTLKLTTLVT